MAVIKGIQTVDSVLVINTDVNPTTGGGTIAPIGSLALASDGSGMFLKTGVLDTDYTKVPVSNTSLPATATTGDILYASASNTYSNLADVAVGNALISGGVGVAPSWGKVGLATHVSGILPVANGGTNISSYAIGDIIFASGATTLSKLADVAVGNVLLSGGVGVAPSYGKVNLATHITGTLPIANGGTGQTTANLALNALLPSQTANTNKYLSSNGVDTSWAFIYNTTVIVKSLSDLPTPAGGEYPLVANTTYLIDAVTLALGTNALRLANGTSIIGFSALNTTITYTGTGGMIRGTDTTCALRSITLVATNAGGQVFDLTNNAKDKIVAITNSVIASSVNVGLITGFKTVLFETINYVGNTNGCQFNGNNELFIINSNYSSSGANSNISLTGGTFNKIIINGCNFSVPVGKIGITVGAITITTSGSLDSNIFDGVGTYLSGFTYATTKWTFTGNVGVANFQGIVNRDSIDFNINSGTTPTTTAGTRAFFGATGNSVIGMSGSAGQTQGCQTTFLVPTRYFGNPQIRINFTSSTTGAGNAKIFCILTSTADGSDFATPSETGVFVLITSVVSLYDKKSAFMTFNPVNFIAGRTVTLRFYRIADDASDTYTGRIYLSSVDFLYDSK